MMMMTAFNFRAVLRNVRDVTRDSPHFKKVQKTSREEKERQTEGTVTMTSG